jgi:glycosyltransferase involved in cell wall biosynthesis
MIKAKQAGKALIPGVITSALWLHDCEYPMDKQTFQIACNSVDKVYVVSEFHKEALQRRMGWDGRNCVVVGNGIVPTQFLEESTARDPHRVIYSSCPTRGLANLLQYWPEVKAMVPEAKLDIYYSWKGTESANPEFFKQLVKLYESVKHLDVKHHGGVPQNVLNRAMLGCGVWAYPHTGDSETFCITAVKAQASGCSPVCTTAGALKEVVLHKEDQVQETDVLNGGRGFREKLVHRLQNPQSAESRQAMKDAVLSRFGWSVVASVLGAYSSMESRMTPMEVQDAAPENVQHPLHPVG